MRPKVSVIIPVYNASLTIERAITSALNQNLQPFEILIYDDCSTDNSYEKISALMDEFDSIKYYKGEKNVGAGSSRDFLLKLAKGDFIAFLDSDDFWHKSKLEKQINALIFHKADICVCGYEIYDESNVPLGFRLPLKNLNFFKLHFSNWIPTSMAVLSVNLKGVRDMPKIRRRQDYAYWLNIFRLNYKVNYISINEKLGGYTRMNKSLSSSPVKNIKYNYLMFRIEMKYSIIKTSIIVLLNILIWIFRT